MLTSGERKTTFDPKKVRNVAAVLTRSHGQVATERTAQKICPRIMLFDCQRPLQRKSGVWEVRT